MSSNSNTRFDVNSAALSTEPPRGEASSSDPPTNTAITYLRVSTAEQATRGGREEGFSIPAQRDANTRKAASLGAVIVAEFVDAGESGTSAAKRPELQAMLSYVREHQVDLCIVHKLDRLARSRADDVAIHYALQQAGVTLVSTSENIDETPSGMLMHGIMSSIAEFYSRNLANEVTKGMVQKASLGGTPHRAPLGYRNVTRTDDLGRTMRTVDIDTERSHLVTWAFFRYADGDCSLSSLLEELTDRGLSTRPTPKRPAAPLGTTAVHKMLHNAYYKGEVSYRGVTYPGLHEPLVDPGTWQKVQDLLAAHHLAGVREQRHQHYLKGSVFCGSCGSKLMFTFAKNRWGTIYPYLVCSGRARRRTDCTRRAMHVDAVADLIEDEYRTIALNPELRDSIEFLVNEEFDQLHAAAETERRNLGAIKTKLLRERKKLLDAHYAGAIPLELLKTEQERIAHQLTRVETRLQGAEQSYDDARVMLGDCLDLARDCHAAYLEADDNTRRLFNQAFFSKIYIDEDETVRLDYNPPFDLLLARLVPAANHRALIAANPSEEATEGPEEADRGQATKKARQSKLTGHALDQPDVPGVQGSTFRTLVELRGFEPLTPSMRTRCATGLRHSPRQVARIAKRPPSSVSTDKRLTQSSGRSQSLTARRTKRASNSSSSATSTSWSSST